MELGEIISPLKIALPGYMERGWLWRSKTRHDHGVWAMLPLREKGGD